MSGRRPDFFIVGGPKCGTTALYEYLRGHPQVFMPLVKEPHHFGSDLRQPNAVVDEGRYLALFAGAADGARAVGEGSTWYLRSQLAAGEIAAFAPAARIIAIVREPVSQMRSMHNHWLSWGVEDIVDFQAAVEAGTDRSASAIRAAGNAAFLDYRSVPRFAEQIRRFQAVVPPERLLVLVFEEFVRDPRAAWRSVVGFLGLDGGYQPSFERVNAARQVRHRTISRFVNAPPDRLRALARRAVPLALRHRLYHQGVRRVLNERIGSEAPSPPADAEFVQLLRAEFEPEVASLAEVIGRPDLPVVWADRVGSGDATDIDHVDEGDNDAVDVDAGDVDAADLDAAPVGGDR